MKLNSSRTTLQSPNQTIVLTFHQQKKLRLSLSTLLFTTMSSPRKSTNPAFDINNHHPRHQRPFEYDHLSKQVPPGYPQYLSPYEKARRNEQKWRGQMNDYYESKKQKENLEIVITRSGKKMKKRSKFKENRNRPVDQDTSIFKLKYRRSENKKKNKKKQKQGIDEYYRDAKAKIEASIVFGEIGVVIDDEDGLIVPDVARKQVCLLCIFLENSKHKNKK